MDLIIEKPRGKPILIEIKSTAKIKHEDLNSLVKIKKDLNHEQAYLLSQDEIEKEIDGIRCIPWNKGLREIFGL